MSVNGWINLNKPPGISSAKAVAMVKRAFNRAKVGHIGTLDPLASGVLPVAINEATKAIPFITDSTKVYTFELHFGTQTTTDDDEGEILHSSDVIPSLAQLQSILPHFIGKIAQTPPVYSAIKINGQRAYALARDNQQVELKSREIVINNIEVVKGVSVSPSPVSFPRMRESIQQTNRQEILSMDPRLRGDDARKGGDDVREGGNVFLLRVICQSGTYIRSLARDIAIKLGTYGHARNIIREKVGFFSLDMSISLENFSKLVHKDKLRDIVYPIEVVLDDILAIQLDADQEAKLRKGQCLEAPKSLSDGSFIIARNQQQQIVAICEVIAGEIKPKRGFNIN